MAHAIYDTETDLIQVKHLHLARTKKTKNKGVFASSDKLARGRQFVDEIKTFCLIQTPNVIMSEIPTGSQSAVAAVGIGVVIGVLSALHTPIIQVTPRDLKIAATGSPTASKQQMISWATTLYPDLPWRMHRGKLAKANEHLADAIAAIRAGIETDQFKQLLALYK